MKKIVLEGLVKPDEVKVEDGGCAKIYYFDDPRVKRFFVRLHSWSEKKKGRSFEPDKHPEFDTLIGKKVRVTVEVIDEND